MHIEETPKLIQPREHKAKIQLWADITVSDMDVISETTTPDQIKNELVRIFSLDDYRENVKSAILLDLYFYTIQFSNNQAFSREQASAFFSIIKRVHEAAIETPFGNVENCFRYFRALVLCHAVKRPPYSIDLFSPEEVRVITEYVINSYFRHFKMYKYVFTPQVKLDLTMTYSGMPLTPEPSEVGDAEAGEDGEENGEETGDGEEPTGEEIDTEEGQTQTGELPAATELRSLIKVHLESEIKKLRVTVDEQIKQSEMSINQKIEATEGAPSGKTGRASAKGNKK